MLNHVPLEFGCFGSPDNPSLIIMHGLLGSSRNWMSLGKELSEHFNVFLVDLRNHGNSPHADSMTFQDMVNDLEHWISRKNLGNFYLMGHSLGGKVAMAYACHHPERMRGLIVEDIAPKTYDLRYKEEFQAMSSINLKSVQSRSDADSQLGKIIEDYAWRQFLMTNLARDDDGNYFWKVNLPVLMRYLPEMMKTSIREHERYEGPTLFIKGDQSDFILDEDEPAIKEHFPRHAIFTAKNSGHNVHVDAKDSVKEALINFLKATQ